MNKPTLSLYTRNRCPLCDKAKKIIEELAEDYYFHYLEYDIAESDELTEKYGLMIPVVKIDDEEIQFGQIDKRTIIEGLTKK